MVVTRHWKIFTNVFDHAGAIIQSSNSQSTNKTINQRFLFLGVGYSPIRYLAIVWNTKNTNYSWPKGGNASRRAL